MTGHETTPSAAHENPTHASRHQFYLGFLAGAVIGAGVAFLSASKKSGHLKKDLLLQAKELSHKLPKFIEDLIAEFDNHTETASEQLHHVTEILSSDPDEIKVTAKTPSATTSEAAPTTESLSQTVAKTAAKAKRFFSKAGRILGK